MHAMRTVVDSVAKVSGPSQAALTQQQALSALRERFPDAILGRYLELVPSIADGVLLAPGAAIIGDVRLSERVSIWYGCVLRGDVNFIEIGEGSNVQDGSVIHVGDHDPCVVAEEVVVGHRAVLHACRVGGGCLIGIQATVLDGAVIGEGSIIGAGALVTAGTVIPPRSLVLGAPGKVIRTLTAADETFHRQLAGKYQRMAHNYQVG